MVRELAMRFGTREVLCGVDLAISAGEVVGLTGGNGTGKSTLLRICAGLLHPRRGSVRVRGVSAERARRRGEIGWSTSGEASFTRRLSLRANLTTVARLAGLDGGAARARIEGFAELLGFRDHLDLPAGRCSTGLRQRAALGRALLHGAPLLLLDEPLRGVDAASALGLAEQLRRRWQTEAVLWVSHSREELALVADRTVHLENGVLRASPASARAA